jgi:hypothetical protein
MDFVNKNWLVNGADLIKGRELGRGSFGVVYYGTLHGQEVALKQIAASASPREKQMAATMLQREVKTLSLCRHKNVIQLIGACPDPPMLVLAYAPNGTLRDLLRLNTLLPSRTMELIHGVCDGMKMLHSKNILHLDLKPENVLISADGTPLVADFGLAIAMSSTLTGGAGSTSGGRGTMQYKAPEHFAAENDSEDSDSDSDNATSAQGETKTSSSIKYDKPADVYSFGMMCWEMFSGKVPFAGKMDSTIVAAHIRALNGGKPKRPKIKKVPPELVSFIEACWHQDPTMRPTFKEAKEMLNAVPILAVDGALNYPGYWDIIIGHSRRCAAAVTLATEAATWFEKKGMSVWLDVRMTDRSTAAMEEGVKNSKYFIAVITGPCVNNDAPNDDPIGNAYFRRPYCIKELRWAQEAGKFIQPILRLEDKTQIGNLLGLLDAPLWMDGGDKNISDLKCLSDTDWIDLNRNDNEYWDLGMTKVCRALKAGEERAAKIRESKSSGTNSTGSTVTSSIERVALEKEIKEKMKLEMKQEQIEKMNMMRAKMEMEYENKAKAEKEAREKAEKEKVSKKKPVSFY